MSGAIAASKEDSALGENDRVRLMPHTYQSNARHVPQVRPIQVFVILF
jgi:hypothetical protein